MIRKYLIALTLLVAPLLAMVAAPVPAQALFESSKQQACQGASLSDQEQNCDDKSKGENKLSSTLKNVINLLTIIVGIIAVILIIINGLRFITSGGDSNSISAARNGIIYALVGLIIVALAQAIVRFVLAKV